mmetsp:Transcript_16275/g.15647  ORF Transcript_16275/g.15647 Transcript_16275/m.15647 type:complete len:180 (-) Transcript_16275:439-978(-)
MTIDINIKTVSIKVKETTHLVVYWTRGEKKAKTKPRLLNESISQAVLDEKFQVTTVFEINSDGRPKSDKNSKISIVHQKEKRILGEANLNLSDYIEDEEVNFKLSLRKCDDSEAFIEVGMKAYQGGAGGRKSIGSKKENGKDEIQDLIAEIKKIKKELSKVKEENEAKISVVKEKINNI